MDRLCRHQRCNGTISFVIFDENSIMALALAFVVFCLGQIFEYGYFVQDENYEII